jgi:hypothetical protein
MRRFVLAVFCASVISLLQVLPVRAITSTPDVVTLQVLPGEKAYQTVTLENTSSYSHDYTVSIFGLSFGESADDLRFEQLTEEQSGWIKLESEEFSLLPNESFPLGIGIEIPNGEGFESFDLAIIVTETGAATSGVGVAAANAILLFVNIGADQLPNLGIETFATVPEVTHRAPVKFAALISNAGNGLSEPQVGVVITNIWGREVTTISLNPNGRRLPPQTNRVFSAEWAAEWWRFGPYSTVLYVFPDDSDVSLTASGSVVLFPWQMLCIFIASTGILGAAIIVIKRARSR